MKESFLSNLVCSFISRRSYDDFKNENAKYIVAIGTCILFVLFVLTKILYFGIIASVLSIVTGFSILFIVYVAAFIVTLDIEVEKEEGPKTSVYKLTVVWAIVLLILGGYAVYATREYTKEYSFKSTTYLVDERRQIFHIDHSNGCEERPSKRLLVKKKGYEIDDSYNFCDWCKQWLEDAEMDYELNRYKRP